MKVIILCGGLYGLNEAELDNFYGPMADIAGKPVIWHVMNHFARYGCKSFIVCIDLDKNPIKDYFVKYETKNRDFEIILGEPESLRFLSEHNEKDWQIDFINTGQNSMSGSMVKMAEEYIDCDNFIVTYGDRLTTLDMAELLEFHSIKEKVGTALVVRDPVRFRNALRGHKALTEFIEKNGLREEFVGGGIFAFNHKLFDYFPGNSIFSLENNIAARLIKDRELSLYVYDHYWQYIDSEREAAQLRNNAHILGIPRKAKKGILTA